jgi:hypothetical protein
MSKTETWTDPETKKKTSATRVAVIYERIVDPLRSRLSPKEVPDVSFRLMEIWRDDETGETFKRQGFHHVDVKGEDALRFSGGGVDFEEAIALSQAWGEALAEVRGRIADAAEAAEKKAKVTA